nr:MauE/DoxX family redox-associated membrane protein [Chitinophaga sp. S165]
MMTLFTGYVYIMLKYSYDLPCSCGGIIEKLTWEQHLAVNFGVTILTIMAIFLQSSMVTHKKLATHV